MRRPQPACSPIGSEIQVNGPTYPVTTCSRIRNVKCCIEIFEVGHPENGFITGSIHPSVLFGAFFNEVINKPVGLAAFDHTRDSDSDDDSDDDGENNQHDDEDDVGGADHNSDEHNDGGDNAEDGDENDAESGDQDRKDNDSNISSTAELLFLPLVSGRFGEEALYVLLTVPGLETYFAKILEVMIEPRLYKQESRGISQYVRY